jgi:hypothetical protein
MMFTSFSWAQMKKSVRGDTNLITDPQRGKFRVAMDCHCPTQLHKIHVRAQAVSRWLFTAAVRVRAKIYGICGGQSSTGLGFLRILRILLPTLIPQNAPYSSIIREWYNRPNSGRRTKWTLSNPNLRIYTTSYMNFLIIALFPLTGFTLLHSVHTGTQVDSRSGCFPPGEKSHNVCYIAGTEGCFLENEPTEEDAHQSHAPSDEVIH